MEDNGRDSSSIHIKYINTRYFYIKDLINSREVAVEHCMTYAILEDYLTKPVQGEKLCAFRDHIMGIHEKVSRPRPSAHAYSKAGREDKLTKVESDPEISHANSKRIRSTGVCWDSVNMYKILSSR